MLPEATCVLAVALPAFVAIIVGQALVTDSHSIIFEGVPLFVGNKKQQLLERVPAPER